MKRFALVLALTLIAVAAHAQSEPRSKPGGAPVVPAVPRTGGPSESPRSVERVMVGEHAPDFELFSAAGARFHLRESRGGWVALFFTDRRDKLPRIASFARTLDSLKVRTLVVCPEKVQSLRAWSDGARVPMLALADERGDISALYGLWDEAHSATRSGLFLLDPRGVIRVALLGQEVSAPSLPGLVQSATDGL